MNTGENEQGLRKIVDLTRISSLVVLGLHFYYTCYRAFEVWGLRSELTDRVLGNIQNTGLFVAFNRPKWVALGLLIVSLLGSRGRKMEELRYKTAVAYSLVGLVLYFTSFLLLQLSIDGQALALLYMGLTCMGFVLVLTGGTLLSRVIRIRLNGKDIFNKENESFPQEERLLENEFSINLPARYHLKDKIRKSWVNIINPFRALLVAGSPGSGKSRFVIRHVIFDVCI
jgi:hypothetical protein